MEQPTLSLTSSLSAARSRSRSRSRSPLLFLKSAKSGLSGTALNVFCFFENERTTKRAGVRLSTIGQDGLSGKRPYDDMDADDDDTFPQRPSMYVCTYTEHIRGVCQGRAPAQNHRLLHPSQHDPPDAAKAPETGHHDRTDEMHTYLTSRHTTSHSP